MSVIVAAHRADPDLEDLLLSSQVSAGMEPGHAIWEVLDVGIVAIVHAARLANALEQVAIDTAVLAEIGARKPQCNPVRIATFDVYRKSERHGNTRCLLFDDRCLATFDQWRRTRVEQSLYTDVKLLHIIAYPRGERVRITARQSDRDVRDRVVLTVEHLDVIQRNRLDVAGRTKIQRTVWVIVAVNRCVQVLFAQFLIIIRNKVGANGIAHLCLDALEVLLRPGRIQQLPANEPIPRVKIVLVHLSGQPRHFLVNLRIEFGCHREHRLVDLIDRLGLRTAVGQHRCGQSRQAFLAAWVESGACMHDKRHIDQR